MSAIIVDPKTHLWPEKMTVTWHWYGDTHQHTHTPTHTLKSFILNTSTGDKYITNMCQSKNFHTLSSLEQRKQ